MDDFTVQVRRAVEAAVGETGFDLSKLPVDVSGKSGADAAMALFPVAKMAKQNPMEYASAIASKIQPAGLIARVEAVNGYVNFYIDPSAMVGAVMEEKLMPLARMAVISLWRASCHIE